MAIFDRVSTSSNDQSGVTDGASKILSEQQDAPIPGSQKQTSANATSSLVGTVLPDVTIADNNASNNNSDGPLIKPDPKYMSDEDGSLNHFLGDCGNVLNIVKDGALKELKENPGGLALTLVEGAVIGAGAMLLAPEVALAAGVAAAGYGIYQVAGHIPGWLHDADVVTRPEDYTDAEEQTAHQDLEGIGRGGDHLIAGLVSGLAAKPLSMLAEGLTDMVLPAVTSESGAATSVELNAALKSGSTAEMSAVAESGAATESSAAADNETNILSTADGQTIAKNQDIFRAAEENNTVYASDRNPSQLRFERVGPGGRIIPNKIDPNGITVPEGDWLVTQMTADGSKTVSQFGMSTHDILKYYDVTRDELTANSELTGFTNRGGSVKGLVKLDDGNWLLNYDYDAAAGKPGTQFMKISDEQFNDWYKSGNDYEMNFVPDPDKPLLMPREGV